MYFKLKCRWSQSHIFTAHPRLRTAVLNVYTTAVWFSSIPDGYIHGKECFASLRSLHDIVFEKVVVPVFELMQPVSLSWMWCVWLEGAEQWAAEPSADLPNHRGDHGAPHQQAEAVHVLPGTEVGYKICKQSFFVQVIATILVLCGPEGGLFVA